MQLNEVLLSRIQTLINEKGVTVGSMLKECGLNRNLITDLKAKGSIPSADKLDKLADYFNTTVDYLLGRSDKRYSQESLAVSSDIPYDELPPEAVKQIQDYIKFIKEQHKNK